MYDMMPFWKHLKILLIVLKIAYEATYMYVKVLKVDWDNVILNYRLPSEGQE